MRRFMLIAAMLFAGGSSPAWPVDSVTIAQLSKKWHLDRYEVLGFIEVPPKKERHDYIQLNQDMTFSSVSEGVYEQGNWRLDEKAAKFYLSKPDEAGEMIFIIDKLVEKKLVLIIDDDSDEDLKYLEIHFKVKP